ncbi:barstar family protein [Streptomyces goshikiensis]|uniref:barstar family protein n=1 Tax=Streptomyces goshikiensis TaxID=1942 RepID=UPI00364EA12B
MSKAPADSADPYVVAARARLEAWENTLTPEELGSPPFFVAPGAADGIAAKLAGAGFDVKRVDVSRAVSEDGLLEVLGEVLEFPDYYGVNWDAYLDCYADFVVSDSPPVALVLDGLDALKVAGFTEFFSCLHELELVREMVGVLRPIIARRVVNVYVGDF